MRFNPTEKAKALLRDWHQMCQDDESNAQPAWNKVRLMPGPVMTLSHAIPERVCFEDVSTDVDRKTTSLSCWAPSQSPH